MEKIYHSNNYTIEVLYHIGAYENSIHFIFDYDAYNNVFCMYFIDDATCMEWLCKIRLGSK